MRYLQLFQQEGYRNERFYRWYLEEKAYDKRGSAILAGGLLLMAIAPHSLLWSFFIGLLVGTILTALSLFEGDARYSGKLPLHMTDRAKRILYTALVLVTLALILVMAVSISLGPCFFLIGLIILNQLLPFSLIAANRALEPYEQRTQQRFRNEAEERLATLNPFIIGITGSYGKTSTKNILAEVLESSFAPTFWPEKGVNTIMGITRQIREKLKPFHRYAVIEMGAYHVGSIKRLCDFTPPKAAIVTAVGIMHLERFKSAENVYKGKSELPQALPKDGILVCNGDNEGSKRMATEFATERTYLYGLDSSDFDCHASNVHAGPKGTTFTIHWQGTQYPVVIPLLGRPAVSNSLASFTMACALGAKPELVIAALRNLPQIENRLSLDVQGKITYLRDAYNSNPEGFKAALDCLKEFPGERKIVITPGMIELGEEQGQKNKEIGEYAAKRCDVIFLVAPTNREALLSGLKEGGASSESIRTFDTREEAFSELKNTQRDGDVILIENDLPDIIESKERF